jgi:hypothetical protein
MVSGKQKRFRHVPAMNSHEAFFRPLDSRGLKGPASGMCPEVRSEQVHGGSWQISVIRLPIMKCEVLLTTWKETS